MALFFASKPYILLFPWLTYEGISKNRGPKQWFFLRIVRGLFPKWHSHVHGIVKGKIAIPGTPCILAALQPYFFWKSTPPKQPNNLRIMRELYGNPGQTPSSFPWDGERKIFGKMRTKQRTRVHYIVGEIFLFILKKRHFRFHGIVEGHSPYRRGISAA